MGLRLVVLSRRVVGVFLSASFRLLRRSQVEEARMTCVSMLEVGGGAARGVARRGQVAGSRAKLLGVFSVLPGS